MEDIKLPDNKQIDHWDLILGLIQAERANQIAKWGLQDHTISRWLVILGEEFGEMCQAALQGKPEDFIKEAVQVIMVAINTLDAFLSWTKRQHEVKK